MAPLKFQNAEAESTVRTSAARAPRIAQCWPVHKIGTGVRFAGWGRGRDVDI